jgi:transposase
MSEQPYPTDSQRPRQPPRLRSADRQRIIAAMPLEDLLEPGHQARIVWDFVGGLNLNLLYDSILARIGGPGAPALDPRIGVALWLYATQEGVGSARALDYLCTHHNAFRWLCGGLSVNYHTLSDFRVEHVEFLDKLFTYSVAALRHEDLVDLNRVAHDGMRVRASAGAASFHRRVTLEESLQEAQDQVQRLKQELHDDPAASSRQQAAQERFACERLQRTREALARLPEMEERRKADEKEKTRVSTTDAQATNMKMPDGGYRPAYNVEFSVDTKSLVIAGVQVLTLGSDHGRITPLLDEIKQRHGVSPPESLADGGFVKLEDIEEAQRQHGCVVYAPVPEPKDKTRERYAPLAGDSEEVAQWRARMGTEQAKAIYKERAASVECVNAQTRNRGLTRLLVRGARKVKAVALWFAIAHNLVCGVRLRARKAALAV